MNCKCVELVNWMKKELDFIDELMELVADGTTLHHRLHGKKDVYNVILNTFEEDKKE